MCDLTKSFSNYIIKNKLYNYDIPSFRLVVFKNTILNTIQINTKLQLHK